MKTINLVLKKVKWFILGSWLLQRLDFSIFSINWLNYDEKEEEWLLHIILHEIKTLHSLFPLVYYNIGEIFF